MSTPDSKPLQVVVVGAGLMGRWHAAYAVRCGARIAAVVDPDPAAAARLARRHEGARAVGDLGDTLAAGKVDVVHVCSPSGTHPAIVLWAIAAGCHVLVEKPLAGSADEIETLLAEAARCGVLLAPVHQFPFQEGFREALSQVASIEPLVAIEMVIASAGAAGRPETEHEALVAEVLPHPFSLLHALLPKGIGDLEWTVLRPAPGDLRAQASAGTTAFSLVLSFRARPTECSLLLRGERGSIHVDLFHGYAYRLPGAVSRARKVARPFDVAARQLAAAGTNLARRSIRREPAYPGLLPLVAAFYRAVRAGGPAPIPPDAVRAVARSCEMLNASGRRWG